MMSQNVPQTLRLNSVSMNVKVSECWLVFERPYGHNWSALSGSSQTIVLSTLSCRISISNSVIFQKIDGIGLWPLCQHIMWL